MSSWVDTPLRRPVFGQIFKGCVRLLWWQCWCITPAYVGVDMFLVISGFLITSHLLGSIERYGRVPFGDFYAKRVRRILPASFFVLVISLLLAAVLYPPLLMG